VTTDNVKEIRSNADSLTVFFPCYNEQENIYCAYETASRVLKNIGIEYEIIFINDGSTDNTANILDSIVAVDSQVITIHHPKNLGYGSALHSGIRAATKSLIFFTDADNQFDLNELPSIMPLIERCDIVACYRENRHDGIRRAFNSWVGNSLVRLLFGLNVKDINCAFKLFRRKVFEQVHLDSTGAVINTEIMVRAREFRFRIMQAPVHHFPRISGRQTGSNLKVIMRSCMEIVQLYRSVKHSPLN
jgi:glycosyltransferase involved in cell wall biosynthesis